MFKWLNDFRLNNLNKRLDRLKAAHVQLHEDISSTEQGIKAGIEHLSQQLSETAAVREAARSYYTQP